MNPNSASGYIYPVAELKDLGIDPVQEATLTTVNDIPSEITAVLNGQMDAAFVLKEREMFLMQPSQRKI